MAATTLEPNQNPAGTKEETNFRQGGLSKWMSGLQEHLASPSLTGTEDEPEPKPITDPVPKPAEQPPAAPAQPKPEVPPPAKPVEPAPAAAAAAAERWPRSAKEWKSFTETRDAKYKEYEKNIQERDARVKELEAKTSQALTPEIQTKIQNLEKENESYSQQLRVLAVTAHPKFKQYFESKTAATLGQLKSFLRSDQIEEVTKIIQLPESDDKNAKLDDLLRNYTPIQQGRLVAVINGLDSIKAEREAEIASAQQDYEKMMAQAKTQKEQQQQNFNKGLDETIKSLQDPKTGRPEYQERAGELEWNDAVKKRIDTARQLITGNLSQEAMFKAAFDAAAYQDILLAYKTTLAQIDKLTDQVSKMTASNPRLEPRRDNATTTGTELPMPKDSRPMDFTKRWVKQFGAAMRGEEQ